MKLYIGNKNYSSWSLRAWILFKYYEIPFQEIVQSRFEPVPEKQLQGCPPSGLVPVLYQGDTVIWETLAIAEYLAEVFPDRNFWPREARLRALARSVCAEMHSGFQDLREHLPMNVKSRKVVPQLPGEVLQDLERVQTIWQRCRELSSAEGPFLFGKFSVADAMYSPVCFRLRTYGIFLKDEAQVYLDKMLSLNAMRQWSLEAEKEPTLSQLEA